MVVYQNVESKQIWVRPYDEFVSEVDHKKYPEVKQKMSKYPILFIVIIMNRIC